MIQVNFDQMPAITADDAYMLTGVEADRFNQPGIYHIKIGGRVGQLEGFEYLGNPKSVELPTIEELLAEAESEFEGEEIGEFYNIGIEEDHIHFGYTEEGYDVFLRI
jgi:hypothetical protein